MKYRPLPSPTGVNDPGHALADRGKAYLSDADLLSFLLQVGNDEKNALDMAREILADNSGSIAELRKLTMDDWTKYRGIGEGKARFLIGALELGRRAEFESRPARLKIKSSRDAFDALKQTGLADCLHEEFWILLLNRRNEIISCEQISSGGMAGTVVDGKIVWQKALAKKASIIIAAHNHPSGTRQPSSQDIALTKNLTAVGRALDCPLADHIIVCGTSDYYSFADEGMI